MAKKKDSSAGLAVGAGLAAAAAVAAAGAYWFYGSPKAEKHRMQVKSWMLKARAEVMEAVEKIEDIDKKKYLAIVQDVVSRYSKTAGATVGELAHMKKDLISTWSHMDAAHKKGAAGIKKAVKKAVKKVAKKVSK